MPVEGYECPAGAGAAESENRCRRGCTIRDREISGSGGVASLPGVNLGWEVPRSGAGLSTAAELRPRAQRGLAVGLGKISCTSVVSVGALPCQVARPVALFVQVDGPSCTEASP